METIQQTFSFTANWLRGATRADMNLIEMYKAWNLTEKMHKENETTSINSIQGVNAFSDLYQQNVVVGSEWRKDI